MTKEQEESIDYVQKQIDYFKKQIKFIEAVDRTYYESEYRLYKNRVKQFETVLNMLKEKDKEIEELKQALARNIAKNFTSSMKESEKSKEDLEMLNKGWQIELERKDKQIDLIINAVYKRFKAELLLEYGFENEEQFKQYFERKSEE